MSKRDIEVEATCLAWEQVGARLAGDAKGAVALWMDDDSILATDGVAKNGKKDRLGRPFGKGRGCGVFDIVIPVAVAPGIVENVPASVKGCSGSGYSNRDLTQHHEVAVEHAMAGKALWVFLCRQEADGTVTMRRIDASRVIREAPSCWLVRDDKRKYTKANGEEVVQTYKRLRIEWARVNKTAPHLYLDADWTEFSATLPAWPY